MVTYGKPFPTRRLGKTGPEVSMVGYGAMGLSIGYGTAKPDEVRLKVLDEVIASGCYFIDTSDIYGDNEELLGKWFKLNPGLREKVFLATKFAIFPVDPAKGVFATKNEPEYIKTAIESSLQKLGTDYVDLYYVHRVQKEQPIEIAMQALKELKEAGKIRHIGLSEVSAETIRRAHAVEPLAAVQLEYSPFALDIEEPERNILNTCRELGISVVAYSPLGRGFLTGRYRSPDDFEPGDFRSYAPRFSKENFPKNLELLDHIERLAKKKGVTNSQLTLAWVSSRGDDIVPIPGTTRIEGLKENFGYLDVTLTEEEREEITEAAKSCVMIGERYPAGMTDVLFADTVPLEGYKA
ncbi:hypothetical protein H072_11177 [Dactylellina haptotyla CBS 200.50]|uniref:NADP-dependent oxidoreductase domain-containing protein n=1 Tax=Dactylellina haptotyla (strain CBS 200.50) TaxID=1284197 RepID=S8BJM0_DACHA|nr:hypothetical protein H072_11177 [Dactylellina haptotyla CBS 200.50]